MKRAALLYPALVGASFAQIALKLGRVRISSELQHPQWGGETLGEPMNVLLRTHRNQGDFPIGFTF